MREITIDCAAISGMTQLQEVLARELSFPEWYGGNLDALYDCLTAIAEETHLCLRHFDALGRYQQALRWVFQDAQEANPRLHICLPEES